MTEKTICKFGGTSLSCAQNVRRVFEIIQSNHGCQAVVCSAPGKLPADATKLTDRFIACQRGEDFEANWAAIVARFESIVSELGLSIDIEKLLNQVRFEIKSSYDLAASRGEWLMAQIMAELTGSQFVDAANVIRVDDEGNIDLEATYQLIRERCNGHQVIVPGFYGATADGRVITLGRGGSDVTASLLAVALSATHCNWTDVDGVYNKDPNQHADATLFTEITPANFLALNACVVHPRAVELAAGLVPIEVCNTMTGTRAGTVISTTAERIAA